MTFPSLVAGVIGGALLLVGVAFLLGGTIGLIRLPDLYARAHAASKCDTVGACSILAALLLLGAPGSAGLKLVLLALLILVSGPTTAHALARCAFRSGVAPVAKDGGEVP